MSPNISQADPIVYQYLATLSAFFRILLVLPVPLTLLVAIGSWWLIERLKGQHWASEKSSGIFRNGIWKGVKS
jgi:hypothetical protein